MEEEDWSSGKKEEETTLDLLIDGAWKKIDTHKGYSAGVGWVIKRNNLILKKGISKVEAATPLQAEAMALWNGIQDCMGYGNAIQVHTDSRELVLACRKPNLCCIYISNIMMDVLACIDKLSFFRIVKVSKDKVKEAHTLTVECRG